MNRHVSFRRVVPAFVAALAVLSLARAGQDEPAATTSQPANEAPPPGRVTGRVTAEAGKTLPEMIVYLESSEPNRRFPAPGEPAVISQKGAKFQPNPLIICVGQSVEFRNDEDRPIEHNVFSRSPARTFDLGLYKPGVDKRVTFEQPGAVRLFCSIHRYMDGMIFVCPTPFFAKVGADGRFDIADVPPGSYRVKTWQARQRFKEQTSDVEVTAGQAAEVAIEMRRK